MPAFTVQQTRARHILLRTSAQLPQDQAIRRLADIKQRSPAAPIVEQAARENRGLECGAGWRPRLVSPGTFVRSSRR